MVGVFTGLRESMQGISIAIKHVCIDGHFKLQLSDTESEHSHDQTLHAGAAAPINILQAHHIICWLPMIHLPTPLEVLTPQDSILA